VTIRTANLTFSKFFLNPSPGTPPNHKTYISLLLPSYMIKFQYDRILLAAIHATLCCQKSFNTNSIAAPDSHVIGVTPHIVWPFIGLIVNFAISSLTFFAI
jgi:hypothetical protein